MGFKIGTSASVSSGLQPAPARTYSQAVDRILLACGMEAAGAVGTSRNQHAAQAQIAVIDAAQRIYEAALWQFRYRWRMFEPEDGVAWYDMPEDWSGRGSFAMQATDEAISNLPSGDLEYIDYHQLLSLHPNLRIPPGAIAAESSVSEVGRHTVLTSSQPHAGVPEKFSIIGNKLLLYPVPSQSVIDELGLNCVLSVDYTFGFYGTMPEISESEDPIPLPPEFLPVHHALASAYFKQSIEYADFSLDEQRAERRLMVLMAQAAQYQGSHSLGDFKNGMEV